MRMEKNGSQNGNMLPIIKRYSAATAGPVQLTSWVDTSSDKLNAEALLAEQLKSVQRNYEAMSLMMRVKQEELREVLFWSWPN
jgi:hypothetical protein